MAAGKVPLGILRAVCQQPLNTRDEVKLMTQTGDAVSINDST